MRSLLYLLIACFLVACGKKTTNLHGGGASIVCPLIVKAAVIVNVSGNLNNLEFRAQTSNGEYEPLMKLSASQFIGFSVGSILVQAIRNGQEVSHQKVTIQESQDLCPQPITQTLQFDL